MAIDLKSGQNIRITISRSITRDSARKTLERIFLKDKSVRTPIHSRSRNFIPLPKRRGGCIWTKRVNMIHPCLDKGESASIKTTPQNIKDLNSVESFVQIATI